MSTGFDYERAWHVLNGYLSHSADNGRLDEAALTDAYLFAVAQGANIR